MFRLLFLLLLTLLCQCLPARAAVELSHQIVTILKKHCAECHAGDKKKGGFSFNTREALVEGGENGAVIAKGSPEKSRLIEVILSTDSDDQMPPKGDRLSAGEVALLKQWISEDVSWEQGFAFKKPAYEPPLKPRRPIMPVAVGGRTHPIDRILDKYLSDHHREPPAPIDDATFARRLHLDLIGLLPEPAALEKFMTDKSPDKRTKLIASLLSDDQAYAEHWLTFWNDLLRNDYGGTGFITGGRKQISKWLYDALIHNKPADQMARELISPPGDESRGFIEGIKWRGDVSAGQTTEIQFAQSVSQSFLGINMKCASCHDSFIDRWKLDEAYGLAAIFSTRPLDIARCDKPTGRIAQAAWLFPEIGQIDPKAAQPERLKQLANLLTHPDNGRFTRTLVNRLWHRLMGHGIVHPVDSMQTEPWSSDLLDHLASDFSDQKYDMKKALTLIATSQAYQSQAEILKPDTDARGYTYSGPRSKRLTAEQFIDAVWRITDSAPAKMDAPVMRGKADPEAVKAIRLSAQWIWGDSAKSGAPAAGETITLRKTLTLPAGLASASAVVTCDNEFTLYVNGRKVSKSEDWQQMEAVPLHTALTAGENTIVMIAKNAGAGPNAAGAYFEALLRLADDQMQSIVTDSSWEFHPSAPAGKEGRLGALPKKGWKPVTVVKALGVWSALIQKQAPALLAQAARGSLQPVRASLLKSDFLMRSLGRPNRDQIVSMRPDDLTTLEAIDLANGTILTNILERGAKKLSAEKWANSAAFVTWLFQSTLCRNPTDSERSALISVIGDQVTEQAVADSLWSLVMLPEFQRVR
ncbi:MAG: DUF1549 domain-containing protein [Verrucomicrobia bacterium]|nr:DUF1549 domain-containing protein [Verrucomicrobiota bacterium]